jgi:hypothetical protein
MKYRNRQVKARFDPETRFEIAPIPSVPFRGTQECALDDLKTRLLQQALEQASDPALNAPLRRAANEAASLAWFTPFPLLVFPVLLEEKAQAVQRQAALQREIRQRSQGLLRTAAA